MWHACPWRSGERDLKSRRSVQTSRLSRNPGGFLDTIRGRQKQTGIGSYSELSRIGSRVWSSPPMRPSSGFYENSPVGKEASTTKIVGCADYCVNHWVTLVVQGHLMARSSCKNWHGLWGYAHPTTVGAAQSMPRWESQDHWDGQSY